VQLLLQAGLRVSEAAALRIKDLEIRERQGKVRIRGKGDKERCVPLNATARRALQTYLDEREETGTQDPVFCPTRAPPFLCARFLARVSPLHGHCVIAP
jgi:site-specific recombinase XerD